MRAITITENKNNNIDINSFFMYFKNAFQTNTDAPPICYEENNKPYLELDIGNSSYLNLNKTITEQEVKDSISNIKSKKSPGADLVVNEMFKYTSSEILPFLT